MASGGKTQSQTTTSAPPEYLQPYLTQIAGEAQTQYQNGSTPSYYPGSTVVPYSAETNQALDLIKQRALAGNPLQNAGQSALLDTIQGKNLNGNPYLDASINAAARPVADNFRNAIAPSIAGRFSASGRYGSGLYQSQQQQAQDTLARALSDSATQAYSNNYNTERQNQLQATLLAPQYAQNDYGDLNALLGVGGAKESQDQAQLQDQVDRYNFAQNLPQQKLNAYMNAIYGQNTGGTQTTVGKTGGGNWLNTALGLGALGAGAYFGGGGSLGLSSLFGSSGIPAGGFAEATGVPFAYG